MMVSTHLASNAPHHRFDPSFEELLHWHRPRYAFKIAQPGESSLFSSPVNCLQRRREEGVTDGKYPEQIAPAKREGRTR
jgi:hypothetical protein